MPRQIALTVALDVQLADSAVTADAVLEDAGIDVLPLPAHVLGMPTLTDTNVPTDRATGRADSGCCGLERTLTRLPELDLRQVGC